MNHSFKSAKLLTADLATRGNCGMYVLHLWSCRSSTDTFTNADNKYVVTRRKAKDVQMYGRSSPSFSNRGNMLQEHKECQSRKLYSNLVER